MSNSRRNKGNMPHDRGYASLFEQAPPLDDSHDYEVNVNYEPSVATLSNFMTVTRGRNNRRGGTATGKLGYNDGFPTPRVILDFQNEPPELEGKYGDEVKQGYVITAKLSKNEYSHYVADDHRNIYKIPKNLSDEPSKMSQSLLKKWRNRFEPNFGDIIAFVCLGNDPSVITNYRKKERQTEKDIIKGNNAFVVKCVLFPEKRIADTNLFGKIEYDPNVLDADGGIVYDAYLGIKVKEQINRNNDVELIFYIAKLQKVSETQVLAAKYNYVDSDHHGLIIDPTEQVDIRGHVKAFRVKEREVVLVKNPDYMKSLRIPFEFDNLNECPIGSYCLIDYVHHPNSKHSNYEYIVMSITCLKIYEKDGYDNFFIELPIDRTWKGFYYEENLGVVSDTSGLLGYLPYLSDIHPSYKTISAVVRYVEDQLCLFDIKYLCGDVMVGIQCFTPENVKCIALIVNAKTGKCISQRYPSLQLRINKEILKHFNIGDMIEATFYPDVTKQIFITSNDEKAIEKISKDITRQSIQISPDYGFFNFQVRKVNVTGKLSKKEQKKRGIEQDDPLYNDFENHFKNYLCKEEFIIQDSKNKWLNENDDGLYVIVETSGLDEYSQAVFKCITIFDRRIHRFDKDDRLIQSIIKKRFPELKVQSFVNIDEPQDDAYPFTSTTNSQLYMSPPPGLQTRMENDNREYTNLPPSAGRTTNMNTVIADNNSRPQQNENDIVSKFKKLKIDVSNPVDRIITNYFNELRKKISL